MLSILDVNFSIWPISFCINHKVMHLEQETYILLHIQMNLQIHVLRYAYGFRLYSLRNRIFRTLNKDELMLTF